VRRFELVEGTSNKFWEISLEGTTFAVCFGRIGTAGQTQQKSFDSAEKARDEHDKLIAEKQKKGTGSRDLQRGGHRRTDTDTGSNSATSSRAGEGEGARARDRAGAGAPRPGQPSAEVGAVRAWAAAAVRCAVSSLATS
jgi:predicted DNA-binding WGR domain protein